MSIPRRKICTPTSILLRRRSTSWTRRRFAPAPRRWTSSTPACAEGREHREDLPMDVVPLGPGFTAELRGVTLADVASDDAAYAAVRAAFEEHSVLVFRGQAVTDEIQLGFSRRFGPPEVTKVGSQGTGSHFVILSTVGPDGKVVPADH